MGSPHHLGVNQLDAMSIPELHEQETDSAEEWIRPGANHSFGTKQGHKHTWLQALFHAPHLSEEPRLGPPSIWVFNSAI